ncbi:MAG: hypothetical protein SFW64_00165 [Alphaproteobacteria bacterium]|nr:hypothetical protein [Alphaproteobacteria bacterium]
MLPDILLGYQKKAISLMATTAVGFVEKSRRVGLTWAIAADAVLNASANKSAGGMDVFYIGFNLDMTKEFIDTCANWAKQFSYAATEVEEFVFRDGNGKDTKEIQAFRINFDSGFEIVALTSRPRSLRGRQGYVIIDEAAFHDDLKELMKAALALLMWGGKVLVISTHDGQDNAFNQYIQDIRAGRLKYGLLRIDFDDALRDGLYQRICLTLGREWSPAAETAWRQEIIEFYGDGADEELFCQPRQGGGKFLPGTLIESRMIDAPVLRYACTNEFVFESEITRQRTVEEWCEENLQLLLKALDPRLQHFFGEDFGRNGDLTSLFPMQMTQSLMRRVPFVVELRNVPFAQQRQIVWYILDRLPRFAGGAFDARGNGSQLAEETMQRYGSGRIHQVMISQAWYLEALPKYKAAFEDGTVLLPRDADILADHRAAELVKGIPQIPEKRSKGKDGSQRHGDSLIAGAMAFWASLQDPVQYGYQPIKREQQAQPGKLSMRAQDDDYTYNAAGRNGMARGQSW